MSESPCDCPTCRLRAAVSDAVAAFCRETKGECLAGSVNTIAGVLLDQTAATLVTAAEYAREPRASLATAKTRAAAALVEAVDEKAHRFGVAGPRAGVH